MSVKVNKSFLISKSRTAGSTIVSTPVTTLNWTVGAEGQGFTYRIANTSHYHFTTGFLQFCKLFDFRTKTRNTVLTILR